MAASFLKQRKNKRFNYKPRYSENANSHQKNDDTTSKKDEFNAKWERARNANAHKTRGGLSMRTLILILVLLLLCMYVLDKKIR